MAAQSWPPSRPVCRPCSVPGPVDSQIERDAPPTDFDRATAVTPLGDGRFAGEVEDGWGAPPGPNGGYLAAIVTRALQHELAPSGDRQLRTLAVHYLRPPRPR